MGITPITCLPNRTTTCLATASPEGSVDWAVLFTHIQNGDSHAVEQLHGIVGRGLMLILRRTLNPDDAFDVYQDTLVDVIDAIKADRIKQPAAFLGYLHTVAKRKMMNLLRENRRSAKMARVDEPEAQAYLVERGRNCEATAIHIEEMEIATDTLNKLTAKQREILRRFYLREESQEQICAEMHLTETQFRLLKSRAKQRFVRSARRAIVMRIARLAIPQRAFTYGYTRSLGSQAAMIA